MEQDSDDDALMPVLAAIYAIVAQRISPSTGWRWVKHGITTHGGQRCCIQVWYVGRKAYTTKRAVRAWMEAVSAARLAGVKSTSIAAEVTPDELHAAGLLSPSTVPGVVPATRQRRGRER